MNWAVLRLQIILFVMSVAGIAHAQDKVKVLGLGDVYELEQVINGAASGEPLIVLTGRKSDLDNSCVVIRPGNGAAKIEILWRLTPPSSATAGTRFSVIAWKKVKDDEYELTLEEIVPGNAQPIMLIADTEIAEDEVGVAIGRQDEFGMVDALVSSETGRPFKACLQAECELRAPNRLDGFLLLAFDEESQLYLYGAYKVK